MAVDKVGMGPSGLGPDTVEGSLDSSGDYRMYLSTNRLDTGCVGSLRDPAKPHKTRGTCHGVRRSGVPDVTDAASAESSESPDHPGNARGAVSQHGPRP